MPLPKPLSGSRKAAQHEHNTTGGPLYIADFSTEPPSFLPTDLDRGNLMDITRLGDAFRRYVDTQTGQIHDGAAYAAEFTKLCAKNKIVADG